MSNLQPEPGTPTGVESYADKAINIVRANPALKSQPAAVDALAQADGPTGNQLGAASHLAQAYGEVKPVLQDHANTVPHAGGFWSDVTHFGEAIGRNLVTYGKGAVDGVGQLAKGLYDTANRTAATITEIGTGGAVGDKGLFHFAANLHDASQTLTNTASYANPFTDWKTLQQVNAYWDSLAARKGNSYAAGEMLPVFLSAVFGGEVLSGGSVTSEAADLSNLQRLTALARSGSATPDDLVQLAATNARLDRLNHLDTLTADAKAAEAARVAELPPAFRVAKGTTEGVSRWLPGVPAKALGALGKQLGGLRTNLFYAATAAHAHASPENEAIWNAVQDGHPLDAHGRPMGTFGQTLAQSFGLNPNDGAIYKALSGVADVGKFFATEPFGMATSVLHAGNTASGIGGVMSKWWPGLGVETGADVLRTQAQTGAARRAYSFMAKHGATEIQRAFPNMYTPELYKMLGNAHSVEDVVNLHADIADGLGLTRHVTPTIGITRFAMRTLKSGMSVGEVLSEDYTNVVRAANEILDKYGVDVKPNSLAGVVSDNPSGRLRAAWSRWSGAQFTKSVAYVAEAQTKGEVPRVETGMFATNDKNAIRAIGDMFRATKLFPQPAIQVVEDTLAHTPDGQDFTYALLNLTSEMVKSAVGRVVNKESYGLVYNELSQQVDHEIANLYGLGGGGNVGLYVNGEHGQVLSQLRNPLDATQTGYFGIGDSHVARMNFMDPREVNRMVEYLARSLNGLSGGALEDAAHLGNMTAPELIGVAQYAKADVAHISEGYAKNVTKQLSRMGDKPEAMRSGYTTASSWVRNVMDASLRSNRTSDFEAFATSAQSITEAAQQSMNDLNTAKKAAEDFAIRNRVHLAQAPESSVQSASAFSTSVRMSENLNFLEGRAMALRDAERQLWYAVRQPNTTMADMREWVHNISMNLPERQRARQGILKEIEAGLAKGRDRSGRYLGAGNHLVNGLNSLLSHLFIPQALSTGGYIIRIASSEVLLNLPRIGTPEFIQSALARAVAKHEARGFELASGVLDGKVINESKVLTNFVKDHLGTIVRPLPVSLREAWHGTLAGVEAGVGRGIDQARFYRLLDDAVSAASQFKSHLPDVGHTTAQLYGETSFQQGARQNVYGVNDKGETVLARMYRGNKYISATGKTIVTALRENMALIANDPKLLGAMKDIKSIVDAEGPRSFGAERQYQSLIQRVADSTYQRILQLPKNELEMLRSTTWPLSSGQFSTGDPLKDYAYRIAYNDVSVVSGKTSDGNWILHRKIIDPIVANEVGATSDVAHLYAGLKESAPRNLIAPSFDKYPWSSEGAGKWNTLWNFPRQLNAWTVDRFFGRILSGMSREPLFTWEYHVAMEDLRPKVAQGIISLDRAEVEASNHAFTALTKFVHNPADRFMFERSTRWYSPFWFAKNQSFRRAFRLLESNPEAAYIYFKSMMLTTHSLAVHEKNGQTTISAPWTESIMNFAANMAHYLAPSMGYNWFSSLGFALGGNTSSLQTVFPTGNTEGWQGLENILRPDPSPIVDIPLKLAQDFGLGHSQQYHDFMQTLLGPIGSKTGILSDVFASSFWRGVGTAALQSLGSLVGLGPNEGAIVQTQVKAMHAALDQMTQDLIDQFYRMEPRSKFSSDAQRIQAANNYAAFETSVYFHEGDNLQKFIDESRSSAYGLYLARLMVYFTSPVAVYLQEKFSKSSEFDKIMAQKMPDGSAKSFADGLAEFSLKYPGHVLDMVSTSQTPYGSFAENNAFLQWWQKAPDVVNQYKNLSAYLVPQGGKWSSVAYDTQISAQLRQHDTPQDYANAVLTNRGDSYYYDYLMPKFYSEYGTWAGPNSPNNNISYKGSQLLDAAAKSYGVMTNPTWAKYGSPLGLQTKSVEATAVEQLGQFVSDTKSQDALVRAGLLTPFDLKTIQDGYAFYNEEIAKIHNSSGSAKWAVEQNLYNTMNSVASEPQNKNVAGLLQMLAKAPTK